MGPGYFVLAIMGCGDGAAMCEEIDRQVTTYETEVACLVEQDAALDAAMDAPYPVVIAQCERVAPQMVEARQGVSG